MPVRSMLRASALRKPGLNGDRIMSIWPAAAGATARAPESNGTNSKSMPCSTKYPRSLAMYIGATARICTEPYFTVARSGAAVGAAGASLAGAAGATLFAAGGAAGLSVVDVGAEQATRRVVANTATMRAPSIAGAAGWPLPPMAVLRLLRYAAPNPACNHSAPCRAGNKDGGQLPRNAASAAATGKSNSGRPCWRPDTTRISSHSTNRLPAAPSALRHHGHDLVH